MENNNLFTKPVKILAAVDNIVPEQLEKRLTQEKGVGERILLIPCNLKNRHWAGILLEIDATGQVLRAEYTDSWMSTSIVPDAIQKQFKNVYHLAELKPRELLKQVGHNSCGAYVIENLLMAAFGTDIGASREEETMRALHLAALKFFEPEFYERFFERQKNNKPTIAMFHEILGFDNAVDGVWCSKKEIAKILEIKRYLSDLKDGTKKILLDAFQYKPDNDDIHSHLRIIRKAFMEALEIEPKALEEMIKILFQIDLLDKEAFDVKSLNLNKVNFRITYEEIIAVARKDITPEQLIVFSQNVSQQIAEDLKLAIELQSQEWSHSSAPSKPKFKTF